MLNLTPDQVPSTSGKYDAPELEAGVYPAVISGIIDLGVQRDLKFDSRKVPEDQRTDKDYTEEHRFWISFAFPTERYEVETEDGEVIERDMIKGKQYKVSTNDRANLQKLYVALAKSGETYADLLGKDCTVSWGPNQNKNLAIVNVAAPMKGQQQGLAEQLINPPQLITEDDYGNLEELNLPEFLVDMIGSRVNQ